MRAAHELSKAEFFVQLHCGDEASIRRELEFLCAFFPGSRNNLLREELTDAEALCIARNRKLCELEMIFLENEGAGADDFTTVLGENNFSVVLENFFFWVRKETQIMALDLEKFLDPFTI